MPEILDIPEGTTRITNEEYFGSYDPTVYHNPAAAVDVVLVDPELRVRLIRRQNPPDHLKLALPGAFVLVDETLADTARRAVRRYAPEITGEVRPLQMRVFDSIHRDPRDRVLSHAHLCPVPTAYPDIDGWVAIEATLLWDLAFDHALILLEAVDQLRRRVWDSEVMSAFLPDRFTITEYKAVVERCTRQGYNTSNLRKKLLTENVICPVGEKGQGKRTLYAFSSEFSDPQSVP